MQLGRMALVVVGLTTWFALTALTAPAQTLPDSKSFFVFDGTGYSNKPDLLVYGIRPTTMVYPEHFGPDWYKDADRLPDLSAVQAVAREAQHKGYAVVLDIEHWPLTGSPELVRDSLRKYTTVLEWFRKAAPGLPVGYYGRPPIHDYGRSITDTSSQQRQAWREENDQLRPLAGAVDVLFPSLYTFYPDQAGWKKYAIAQIAEARRYGNGKPVYVFLWPKYHGWNPTLGGTHLSADYWLLQLETAREYADGIVLWDGSSKWNEDAPWWKVTKEFMKSGDRSIPAAPTSLTIR